MNPFSMNWYVHMELRLANIASGHLLQRNAVYKEESPLKELRQSYLYQWGTESLISQNRNPDEHFSACNRIISKQFMSTYKVRYSWYSNWQTKFAAAPNIRNCCLYVSGWKWLKFIFGTIIKYVLFVVNCSKGKMKKDR